MIDVKQKGSVEKWIGNVADKVKDGTAKTMLQAAELAAGAVRREVNQSFRPGTEALARSFTATLLAPKQGKLRSGAISDSVYARIQDQGGTIVPRNAKALTVPVSQQAKSASRRGIGAREFPSPLALIWPKGRDRGYLVEKGVGVHYVLRKSVTLPGRTYLLESAKAVEPELNELFDGALEVAAGEAETE